MGNGSVAGAIVMAICCFSCAIGFFALDSGRKNRKYPSIFGQILLLTQIKLKIFLVTTMPMR